MDDARFLNELRRYWDEIARGGPATPGDLDPEFAATIRRLHALPDVPPPDPTYAKTLRESIMNAQSIPFPIVPGAGPAVDGHAPPVPRPFAPPVPWSRARGQWVLVQAATVLLVIAALFATIFLVCRDDRPVIVPADATPIATEGSLSDIPIYRGNPARTGEMPGPELQGQPVELWRFQAGGSVNSTPALVAGTLYVGADDGNFYALDAATGSERWRFAAADVVASSPAVSGDLAYVSSSDGTLYAIDTATGAERWQWATAGVVQIAPLVVDGMVYSGGDAESLYALDAVTGEERWRSPLAAPPARSAAYSDGTVYIGSRDGALHAVDAATGEERWRTQTDNADGTMGTPVVAAGAVYQVAFDGPNPNTLYAFDAATGEIRWRFQPTEEVVATTGVADGTVYVGSAGGTLFALDATTGTERWRFVAGDVVDAAPALVGGTVYLVSHDRNVYAVNATNGAEQWRFAIDSGASWGPIASGGVLYLGTTFGSVYAIGGSESEAGSQILSAPSDPGSATAEASPDVTSAPVEFVWEVGSETAPLQQALDVTVAPDGNVWVADLDGNQIVILDPSGTVVEIWGTTGSADGELKFGTDGGVVVDSDGNSYVLDSGNYRVQKFDRDHTFVLSWGGFGTGDGQFVRPTDLALDSEGNVYVIDYERRDVQKFDSDGALLAQVGGPSEGEPFGGALARIGVDAAGNLFVPNGSRVYKFAPDGALLLTIGSDDGPFTAAIDVAVDAVANIYTSDAATNQVLVFDVTGRLVAAWGSKGTGPGQFNGVDALAFDGADHLYVLDFNNNRIQKFRLLPPLGPAEPATPAP